MQDIIKKFGSLSEEIIKSYVLQLIQALKYLEKNGIFVKQVKSKKILIANDGTLNLIPDLSINNNDKNHNVELMTSIGYILFEMFSGKLIATNSQFDIDKIKCGEELKKLIKYCFASENHCKNNLEDLTKFAFLNEQR